MIKSSAIEGKVCELARGWPNPSRQRAAVSQSLFYLRLLNLAGGCRCFVACS
jgi:hypothetical protein